MTPNHTCETCWHFNAYNKTDEAGTCQRYPPVPLTHPSLLGHMAVWPEVKGEDHCGEWGPSGAYDEECGGL